MDSARASVEVRILVTGSRDWTDKTVIARELDIAVDYVRRNPNRTDRDVTLVSGKCPTGADRLAELYAAEMGWDVELHPADWDKHGKRAGFMRNAEMVDLGASVCCAFIKNDSRGASHTLGLARKAGIVCRVVRITETSGWVAPNRTFD